MYNHSVINMTLPEVKFFDWFVKLHLEQSYTLPPSSVSGAVKFWSISCKVQISEGIDKEYLLDVDAFLLKTNTSYYDETRKHMHATYAGQ